MASVLLCACREERVVVGEGASPAVAPCDHPAFCAPGSEWTFEMRDGTAEPALGPGGEETATRFVVSAPGGYARFQRSVDPPLQRGELHLAAQVRVESGFSVAEWVVVMEAKGPTGKVSLDIAPTSKWQLYTDTLSTSAPDSLVLRDTWLCASLSMGIAADGWATAQVQDGPSLQIEPADTLQTGGITGVYFGLTTSAFESDSSEVVVDDLRVSDAPIDCP